MKIRKTNPAQTMTDGRPKERPIRLSAPKVKAVLEQRKTQARFIVKPQQSNPKVLPLQMQPWIIDGEWQKDKYGALCWTGFHPDYPTGQKWFSPPFGKVGDILWVQETFQVASSSWCYYLDGKIEFRYKAGGERKQIELPVEEAEKYCIESNAHRWKPCVQMPKIASRLLLEITSIRIERLQDISEKDAKAEGVESIKTSGDVLYKDYQHAHTHHCHSAKESFLSLWDLENGYAASLLNPFVWVIEFKQTISHDMAMIH